MKINARTPLVLSIVGAIGVIATAYFAAKATPSAIEKLYEHDCRPEDFLKLPAKEKIKMAKIAAPEYIPAIACGAATITCILSANHISRKQQAQLASAYVMIDQAYRDYKRRVKELIGEDGERKIRSDIAKENYIPNHFDPGPGEQLFYDYTTGAYFESSFLAVVDAEYQINRKLVTDGEISLREYCELFGIDIPLCSELPGWSINTMDEFGVFWLDFDHELTIMEDGLQCYIIIPLTNPSTSYRD